MTEYQLIPFGDNIKLQAVAGEGKVAVHGILIDATDTHIAVSGGEQLEPWFDGEHTYEWVERFDVVATYDMVADDVGNPLTLNFSPNVAVLYAEQGSKQLQLPNVVFNNFLINSVQQTTLETSGDSYRAMTFLPSHRVCHISGGGYALVSDSDDTVIAFVFLKYRKAFKAKRFADVSIAAIDHDREMQVFEMDDGVTLVTDEEYRAYADQLLASAVK